MRNSNLPWRILAVLATLTLSLGLLAACGDDDDDDDDVDATTAAATSTTAAADDDEADEADDEADDADDADDEADDADDGESVTVELADNAFSPDEVTIDVGDTVTWDWADSANPHSVVGTSDNAADLESEILTGAGNTFEFTFTDAGTYEYQCSVHGTAMTGVITVED
jgi:plastocyanin